MPELSSAEFEKLSNEIINHFEFNKELVLSTSHVTEFECNNTVFINYSSDEHNARFHVNNTLGDIRDYGVADHYSNLNRLLELAKWCDCKWLVLDGDGDVSPELKTFEW